MATYDMTADELLLCYLTFLARDEEDHAEYFTKWFSNGGQARLRDLFNSLKEKGIIHKNYNPTTYNPNDIEFNKNFIKGWIKNSGQLGQELFDAYPSFLQVNSRMVSLRNISKKFTSLNEFFFHYSKEILHNPDKHKQIMELLEWGKQNQKIHYGIIEFVCSHKWDELEQLRDGGYESITIEGSILIDD